MEVDPFKTTCEVYHVENASDPVNIIFWVKFYFPEHELYIAHCTVRKSPVYPDSGWWFQPPTHYINGKRIRPIEYKATSRFGRFLKKLGVEAVEKWISSRPP